PEGVANEVESLKIELKAGNKYDLTDSNHKCTAESAYSFKSSTGTAITNNVIAAGLKTGQTATIKAELNVTTLKTATAGGETPTGDHNFTGSFGVTITPVTTP
ncbi:MAG: hypothetical protein RR614_11040, partial [Eubacterium sp.]